MVLSAYEISSETFETTVTELFGNQLNIYDYQGDNIYEILKTTDSVLTQYYYHSSDQLHGVNITATAGNEILLLKEGVLYHLIYSDNKISEATLALFYDFINKKTNK